MASPSVAASPAAVSAMPSMTPDFDDTFAPPSKNTWQRVRFAGGALGLLLLVFLGIQLSLLRGDLGEAAVREKKVLDEQETLAKKATMERDEMQAKLAAMEGKESATDKAGVGDEKPMLEAKAMADGKAMAADDKVADKKAMQGDESDDPPARKSKRAKKSSFRTTTSALRPHSRNHDEDDDGAASSPAAEPSNDSAKTVAKEPAKPASSKAESNALVSRPTSGATSSFNVAKAGAALNSAARTAASCGKSGQVKVRVLFTNAGNVQRVNVDSNGLPNAVNSCVVRRFQNVRIPAYSGAQAAVSKTVSLR